MTLSDFVTKVIRRLKGLKTPAAARRFMKHNRGLFPFVSGTSERKPLVLFELNLTRSAHIAYSYLANVLATEQQTQIAAYLAQPLQGWRQTIYFWIKRAIGFDQFGIYESFGVTTFLNMAPCRAQKAKAKTIFATILPRLRNKQDIEELVVEGILVGDLIYDTYLRNFYKPTINCDSREFQSFLLKSVELFVVWTDYLDTHDVRAINVSHCVYNLAMPLRLAVKRGIPVFQATATHLYRLSESNMFAYNDFFYFPERFAALPVEVREAGLVEAKRRIERRFAGEVGVDMEYSTKSAYGATRHARLLRESPRKKILIATHCFFDSPHSYGNNIFPDFYEWLDFLGKMTEVTDYDWYVKTHPDFLVGTKEIIDSFIARYPKFTLLPADASHHQIISEGINLALTVYGTIAFEYAALGIPVIIASQNNPHIAYNFNCHARDIEDYRWMLLNLDSLDLNLDTHEICEYYFMRYIYSTENLFFENYDRAITDLGGYYGQFEPAVYDRWNQDWSPEKHSVIVSALRAFVRSGDFRMDYTHYGHEFTVESMR